MKARRIFSGAILNLKFTNVSRRSDITKVTERVPDRMLVTDIRHVNRRFLLKRSSYFPRSVTKLGIREGRISEMKQVKKLVARIS